MADMIYPGTATPAQVLTGQTFSAGSNYNAAGTMANNGAVTITPGTANQTIAAGYHNGSGIVNGDANLVAANIHSGISIFGVAGSLTARMYATGSATSGTTSLNFTRGSGASYSSVSLQVGGLTFQPSIVIARLHTYTSANYEWILLENVVDMPNQNSYAGDRIWDLYGGTLYDYKIDGTNAYVNSLGFQIPVVNSNAQFDWYAWG